MEDSKSPFLRSRSICCIFSTKRDVINFSNDINKKIVKYKLFDVIRYNFHDNLMACRQELIEISRIKIMRYMRHLM